MQDQLLFADVHDSFLEIASRLKDQIAANPQVDRDAVAALSTRGADREEHVRQRYPKTIVLVDQLFGTAQSDPAIRDLAKILSSRVTPSLVRHGSPISCVDEFWPVESMALLALLWAESPTHVPEPGLFPALIERRAKAWQSPAIQYRVLAPLQFALVGHTEPISFAEKFSICLKTARHNSLLDIDESKPPGILDVSAPACSLLIATSDFPKSEDVRTRPSPPGVSDVFRVVTALRLATSYPIYCQYVTLIPKLDFLGMPGVTGRWTWTSTEVSAPDWLFLAPVQLTAEQLKATTQYELALRQVSGSTEIAIERYNYSLSRTSLEDQLIDLVIALEATLLAGKEQELRFRLSLRGTILLGKYRNSQDTYKLLQAAYDARSAVVHNGKKLKDCDAKKLMHLDPSRFISELRSIVVDVLRLLVEHAPSNPESLMEDIDAAILNVRFEPAAKTLAP